MLRTFLRCVWAAAVVFVISMYLLPSSSPLIQWSLYIPLSDKALHFSGFLVLATVPALNESRRTAAWLVAALGALGAGLEFAQVLSAGRAFELGDMAANGFGITAGLVIGLGCRFP